MKRLAPFFRQRLAELDRLLRGDATQAEALEDNKLDVSAGGLLVIAMLLAAFYGLCMGSFSLLKEMPVELVDPYGPVKQVLASMIKTPALFLLTLLVTLPSLYVFNALVGSRLTLLGMTRLLVAAMSVNIAVLASLGAIVVFFSLTTKSYPFILLLNVAAFTVAGVLGMLFLLQTLHRMTKSEHREHPKAVAKPSIQMKSPIELTPLTSQEKSKSETTSSESTKGTLQTSALDMPQGQVLGGSTKVVFRCWIILFSLVGAQMGWVLRPFVGSPNMPFTFFRERDSNFFAAVVGALQQLFTGG
ncbi:hypothetical protein [Adhaeretor mobilis]|uniref:Uncharacterized protein n=1 Tax=Adhaeretor mobilis TaxID=1930276 RepID=A0A517MQ54_9BACT|nr:hypothetical protein [Adhaeretor mobilis]QDS97011.1 hypothetical protein HG15A2_02700 [Adhaeretor mobilis]